MHSQTSVHSIIPVSFSVGLSLEHSHFPVSENSEQRVFIPADSCTRCTQMLALLTPARRSFVQHRILFSAFFFFNLNFMLLIFYVIHSLFLWPMWLSCMKCCLWAKSLKTVLPALSVKMHSRWEPNEWMKHVTAKFLCCTSFFFLNQSWLYVFQVNRLFLISV